MLFKKEENFRDDIINTLKDSQDYKLKLIRNIYKLENFDGRGLPDLLIISYKRNTLIELKVHDNNSSPLQKYNQESNPYCLLCQYVFKQNKDIFIIRRKERDGINPKIHGNHGHLPIKGDHNNFTVVQYNTKEEFYGRLLKII